MKLSARNQQNMTTMSNKKLAIFGIASYLLSVYASQTNTEGVSTAPAYIVILSGVSAFVFTIIATVRLWKYWKLISILFGGTSLLFFAMEVMQVRLSPTNGTTLILIINTTKVINLLLYFYVIFLLFRIDKY